MRRSLTIVGPAVSETDQEPANSISEPVCFLNWPPDKCEECDPNARRPDCPCLATAFKTLSVNGLANGSIVRNGFPFDYETVSSGGPQFVGASHFGEPRRAGLGTALK